MHYRKNITMPLTDTHAHLDFYTENPTDREDVLRRAYAAGVHTILAIGIGEGPDTMHQALEIATSTSGAGLPTIYASAGIHPQEAASATPVAARMLRPLRRVVLADFLDSTAACPLGTARKAVINMEPPI